MALPAGRYGVTKNQLLKIKKLPMNTIKLIEELTEKFDLLGTAAFKNSTSVVTESSDLVESGAVFDAIQGQEQLLGDTVGWTGKNINKGDSGFVFIKSTARTNNFLFGRNIVKDKKYTVSFNVSDISGYTGTIALYVRFISDGVQTDDWSILTTATGLVEHTFIARKNINVGDAGAAVYCFIGSGEASEATVTVSNFMIREANITDPTYEPYHATVDESKCDNSVIAPTENGTTASQAYAVGEHFIRDGAFCTCKQAISQGGSFTLNTNYTAGDVAGCLIKHDTFSATTSTSGNFRVTEDKTRVILRFIDTDGLLILPYKTTSNDNNAHVVRPTDMSAVANESVSGTYYYI